jgi:large subunit ribosomal protein L9
MARNVKLMLTENVESLGIVGDVVNVRIGYARNFLLPRDLATQPSDEAIKAVAAKRADAEKQLAALRKDREGLVAKMDKAEISITRSCNDLGHLYGSVTQQEIASALAAAGFTGVRPRDVRLNTNIKRIDNYDIHIKFESDLESVIKLHVLPDRKIEQEKREEMEFDNEGRLIHKKPAKEGAKAEGAEGEKAEGEAKDGAKGAEAKDGKKDGPRRERPRDGGGEGGEKPRRRDDDDRPRRGRGSGLAEAMAAMEAAATKKTGWGAKKDAPAADAKPDGKSSGKSEARADKSDKGDKKAGKDKKSK